KLIEKPVTLVDRNGAPSGEKTFVFWNPPVVNRELGIRRSALKSAQRFAELFLENGVSTILFAGSRLSVEILTKYLKDALRADASRVEGYRGGYLPTARRAIEKGLREGTLSGVVSTNALELGIDIGALDACVLCGYPGTIAATWQQAGRAGRRKGRSVVILVARSDPLDQFIVEHPEYFFGASPEHGRVSPDNLLILASHVKCAAFELPFEEGERFGETLSAEDVAEVLDYLAEKRVLHKSGGRWHWMAESYPASEVSLRSASPENFVVVDRYAKGGPRIIAEVDWFGAPMTVHPEAIYLCEGVQWHVEELDWERRKAFVKQIDADYYTDAMTYTGVSVLEVFESAAGAAA
ncbi:MAG: hypothetical protein K8I02_05925, partial [Candidatus Methylomirabilis sp.]|nr:hypothetical protein [Deltaproteobacteria bacterium]